MHKANGTLVVNWREYFLPKINVNTHYPTPHTQWHWFNEMFFRSSKDFERKVILKTCWRIWGNSETRVFRPWSSKIFSNVMSCRATKVVSSMSRPAWFAKVKTGRACRSKWNQISNAKYRFGNLCTCMSCI